MHRIATKPGDLDSEKKLESVRQTPADILFISTADTELSGLAQVWGKRFRKKESPTLRLMQANPLQHPDAAEHYAEYVLCKAKLAIFRLHGGYGYFPHLLDEITHIKSHGAETRILVLPGTDEWDPELLKFNDYAEPLVQQMFSYFREGGIENMERAAEAVELLLKNKTAVFPEAIEVPRFGWRKEESEIKNQKSANGRVWITYYRALQQTGDMAVVEALTKALKKQGLKVSVFYAYSLREPAAQEELLQKAETEPPDAILTMQSFSIGRMDERSETGLSFLEKLNCPVIQVPTSTEDREAWLKNPRGFSASNAAMSVVLPETDGRLFSTVVGFKQEQETAPELEFCSKRLAPDQKQVSHVAELTANWACLRRTANSEKRVAIILANYPNKDSRLGNGVGLDTPASVIAFLHDLEKRGYLIGNIPEDGDELIRILQAGITNDSELSYAKTPEQGISRERLFDMIGGLLAPDLPAEKSQATLAKQWTHEVADFIPIAGKRFGNIFIGIQPQRGFGLQTQAIYHDPALSPPPEYLAFYQWIREDFDAHAVIHFGKHGNLEWLPGRSVALGSDDFPQIALKTLPNLYPFIVNDPGEGAQAKRRASAVIVDHLTPPLTRAGLYEELDKAERLLEEHAHCETLYPERAHELEHEIEHLLEHADWSAELPADEDQLNALSNHLCELKESQIRSGLHIFGQLPEGEKKIDFLLSLLRMPAVERPGLLQALLGKEPDFDLDTLSISERDEIEQQARDWIKDEVSLSLNQTKKTEIRKKAIQAASEIRSWLHETLLPRFNRCAEETRSLALALEGRFVSPGPSGAPTRGRIDVLPTGRNFYSVDPRVIPTQTAWRCGQALAEELIERYRADHGEFPKTTALVIWGTSNMRTGGDDIAQALALWGCEPVWEPVSGRVVDFEIMPLSVLGRPRVDVVLRVSGMFRDSFGDVMRLLSTVPKRLAELDEPEEMNPVRAAWLSDQERLKSSGVSVENAKRLAELRVFSSGPGAYGTGLLPLIDAGNWETRGDLTEVFLKWGSHAYDSDGSSSEEINLLRDRLSTVEIVHQNQDNREHDILDSDDYFQFQGGLQAAITEIKGSAPATYHGDSSNPEKIKIRTLKEEFNRVFRSRVLNPKWLVAMRGHGYKGAFEMAATVDYLFGYDATCDIVADYQYEEVANKLLLDPEQQKFFREHNPLALKDASQRLLEANEREMWENADPETLEALESAILEIQGEVE
ncbi:MAG: cobaltochelatase subunit CobN [SAR324 cluster bacterium]|nr:cobaltochelatase subunit CobN [SAR324 cluster bacterium]MBL7034445.1 cobaltochelatase subunit CobN [SAR324 cluster bacterium]